MPFTDQTEYPRGIFHTAVLTNAAQDVGTAGEKIKVSHFLLTGGAAAEIVIFRNSAGTNEYFRVPLAAGEKVVVPRGFVAEVGASHGLEVLTADAAGDVYCTIFYFKG